MSHLIKGDIVKIVEELKERHPGRTLVLVHGCNCMNNMGAGLARRISDVWPEADEVDKQTTKYDRNKLGTWSSVRVDPSLLIVNLYTQYKYGGVYVNVDYDALETGLTKLVSEISESTVKPVFLVPEYIGCGLAGGDINIVRPILEKRLQGCNYYLFDK